MLNIQKSFLGFLKTTSRNFTTITKNVNLETIQKYHLHLVAAFGGSTFLFILYHYQQKNAIHLMQKSEKRSVKTRFMGFASVEYQGQIYMTPLDFLQSVLEVEPSRRYRRKSLGSEDIETIKRITPKEDSRTLFRDLKDKGIISYMEYLFLLSMIMKPTSSFNICFKMMDTDNSDSIDKQEYLELERVFYRQSRPNHDNDDNEEYFDDKDGLQKKKITDTTMMIHFFGKDTGETLNYKRFESFLLNLQEEVLEVEFLQFSHGLPVITDVDFAQILLRYSYIDEEQQKEYIERLLERSDNLDQGITLEEFKSFMRFLDSLNDFNIVMKYYSQLKIKASITEFKHAVKVSTGQDFSLHLIQTIFNLFDVDGDGNLSYDEFVNVMRDRLNRGFTFRPERSIWNNFKKCVKRDMKARIEEV